MNPYVRAAARLREEAELKLQQRLQDEQSENLTETILVRAHDKQGRFIADDPTTPDVDEAWVEIEVPKSDNPYT